MANDWTLWSERRPTDTNALYRWRIPAREICGMTLRPEWSEKLIFCGMGYDPAEWWPQFSNWDGYRRSLPPATEWRLAGDGEDEKNIFWCGLELLPCPHTGKPPVVEYHGRYIGAPPYQVEWLHLKAWMVSSTGWRDAKAMQDAWNRRAPSKDTGHG